MVRRSHLGSATGAGWIVVKRYIEKVGDEGWFKKAPIGAGPYRFVSFRPGIEPCSRLLSGIGESLPP
jgi:peptide/nickel transport system substrate-binding protein